MSLEVAGLTHAAAFLACVFSLFFLLLEAIAAAEETLAAPVPVAEVDHEHDHVEHQAEGPDGVRDGPHFVLHRRGRNEEPVDGHTHSGAQGEDHEKEPRWEHHQDAQRIAGPAERVPDPRVQGKDPWRKNNTYNKFTMVCLCVDS